MSLNDNEVWQTNSVLAAPITKTPGSTVATMVTHTSIEVNQPATSLKTTTYILSKTFSFLSGLLMFIAGALLLVRDQTISKTNL